MSFKGQTAIRGVFSVGLTNFAARLVGYGKHMVIAAYVGLTVELDAFFMAMAVLSIFIFTFGEVFDALGIPRLVEAIRRGDQGRYRLIAGEIFLFAMGLTLILGLALLAISPVVHWIAPGFGQEKKRMLIRSLAILAPLSLVYLPYHAIGSFLRAKRRFQSFYVGEIIIATASLFIIILFHEDSRFIVAISTSVSYVIAFCFMLWLGKNEFRIVGGSIIRSLRENVKGFLHLLPLYLIGYMYIFVDRAFASFLPTGEVSALTYAMLIFSVPVTIFMLENIFITPLAESPDRSAMMSQILNGIIILSIPMAIFTIGYSKPIVRAALERGLFTSVSTEKTAGALYYLGFAIPAAFVNPVSYRLFQILNKLKGISIVGFITVGSNAILNYVFLHLGMGLSGLALATTISNYLLLIGAILLMKRFGIHVITRRIFLVAVTSAAVGFLSYFICTLLPINEETVHGILVHGLSYVLFVGIIFSLVPVEEIRVCRLAVYSEVFPKFGK